MTRRRLLLSLPIAVVAATVAFVAAPRPAIERAVAPEARASEPEFVPRRALVGPRPGRRAEVAERIRARGGRVVSFYEPGDFFVVETPGRAPSFVESMRRGSGVRFVDLDYTVTADETIPNDPRWPDLWGLKKIGMPVAWDTTRGSSSIVVGVTDTGVEYRHPELTGQMWTNRDEVAANGVDDDGNGFVDDVHGADCANADGDPLDDNGHGTHVAGTIGAATNNSTGIAGVNWYVRIMALKFLNSEGSGSTLDAIRCIDYAIAEGATLTNNSWGEAGYSQALADAIDRARVAGQLFVASAGNSGTDIDAEPSYPASYDLKNIVVVAATDAMDDLPTWSNRGAISVDLAAPGVSILSTVPGGYAWFSGTSMATPHVAGAAALVHAARPAFTWSDVRERLLSTVDVVPSLDGQVATGGRLNAARAVEPEASPSPSPSPASKPAAVYAPTAVKILKGRSLGDPISTLVANDGARFRVRSTRAKRPRAAWRGQAQIDASGASTLALSYDGSASRTVRQRLAIYDFAIGSWQRFSSTNVSTTDRTLMWSTSTPARYVSSASRVYIRVQASARKGFKLRTDLVRFRVGY